MKTHMKRVVSAIAAVAVGNYAIACSLCSLPNDSFSVPHPHALRIASATRQSREDGTLHNRSIKSAAEFEGNLVRLVTQVTHLSAAKHPVSIDVLLVDDAALYRVDLNGLQSRVTRLNQGIHAPAETRIVTTAVTVSSIGQLEVRIPEAINKGILELEKGKSRTQLKAAGSSKPNT